MSRKSAVDAIFATRAEAPLGAPNEPEPPSSRVRSGAVSAMGASLQQLTESAKVAAMVEAGAAVVELDPKVIERSFVADRIADPTDASLASLVESIRESGQQVPILVRHHPKSPARYQVAYGHRRLLAAEQLGIKVRAVIKDLTDPELVVAQGKENLERRDLSFIERAFFALRLEELHFERGVIAQALASDKGDVSRYITVARAVPEHIASAIGPAPKAGRARWLALAERLKANETAIKKVIGKAEFSQMQTDERFVAALEAGGSPKSQDAKSPAVDWADQQGRKLARVDRVGHRFSLSIDERIEPAFGDYLLERLPEILADFRSRSG